MADFGAVGRQPHWTYHKTTRSWTDATRVIRQYVSRTAGFVFGTNSSAVSGLVKENGVPCARVVRVYRRDTGELIGSTTSASGGSFTVTLNGFVGNVFVIAFDADALPNYNAQIYDMVVPV